MPLLLPPAPPSSIDALQAVAPSLASSSSVMRLAPHTATALSQSVTTRITPTLSYRVYVLTLETLPIRP